ncbi:MAG TPA: NTP transferase domain-containing protein [Phycisphaerae bacterium]|nr:NTP transferase domain-containing protein [Phycisphaerae bacterium]
MSSAAIILAAGKSTRMKSKRVKVLHEICGRPMLAYVIDAVREAGVDRIVVVVGHDRQQILDTFADQSGITWVYQEEQKGTGHAVQVCAKALERFEGSVFVLAGDGPLIRGQTLKMLLEGHQKHHAALTLATSVLSDPKGYGRIVRDADGNLTGIVEEKDATPEQRRIKEINPSYYLFNSRDMFSALTQITNNNQKGEYYLTDAAGILKNAGRPVYAMAAIDPKDVLSINSRSDLALVNQIMQKRIQEQVMDSGVTIVNPESTWIEFGAKIGEDTVLEPFTWVGSDASIEPGSHVSAGTVIARGGNYRR